MELSDALTFVASHREGVLTTLRRDGRPQLSNILYLVGGGVIRISTTKSRAKTKNLGRDPRASLYVVGENFWTYVVLDAAAELSPVATDSHDAVVEDLVAMYREAQGEHPDWDEFRQAMVDDGRLVIRLHPEHAYGQLGQ